MTASCDALNPVPDAAKYRRSPVEVMRLARMGSFHPTRLSFMQVLLRRMKRDGWRYDRRVWDVDAQGVGRAVYTVHGPERAYSLVAFAHDLPDDMRSDRVIATAWDATFALFDGVPGAADLDRLAAHVPRQEAGRVSDRELTLSRANRSVRLFAHVVGRLADGRQPDADQIDAVGYLMRTTAVYGSGKFGAADRAKIAARADLGGPFQAEMLTVWLIRAFTVDLVEHLARVDGGDRAARLSPDLRRRIGVGNSTGLGMAPFLVNHPVLLNNWMMAREEALARVRAQPTTDDETGHRFRDAVAHARENADLWHSAHPMQQDKLDALRCDLAAIEGHIGRRLSDEYPWDTLWRWASKTCSTEGQEALVSLLIEVHGPLVDGLAECMSADEDSAFRIDGSMRVDTLRDLLKGRYDWALGTDHTARDGCARFWYVSEEKLEPRLGERHEEPGAELETPLAIGRDICLLAACLDGWPEDETVAAVLLAHPEHRHIVRRAQIAARHPFAEIRDNLIAHDMLPIDLLRCKLSFFGASRFDPRSDRWVRICMYRDAPQPDELLTPAR